MAKSITVALELDDAKFKRSLNNSSKSVDGLGSSIGGIGTKLAGIAAAAAGAFTFSNIVETTARFEDLKTALTSVTGSIDSGKNAFAFVQDFATKTQFGVEELTEAYIKLKASGIEPTEKLLTTFTDTAAVTTDQLGSLTAMTDLLSRTTSGGLGLEELNRLADRGIPVFKILEEQMGLTRMEISEFGKTAEGAKLITDALLTGLDQEFGGATQERLGNLSTALSNLDIASQAAMNTVGEGLAPALNDAVSSMTDFITANEDALREVGELIGKGLVMLIENLDTVTNAVVAFGTAWTVMKIAGLISSIRAMGGAMAALNAVMLANPIGLLAAAIGLAVLGFLELSDSVGGTENAFKTLGNVAVQTVNMIISAFSAAGTYIYELFSDIGSTLWDVITGELDWDKLGDELGGALTRAGAKAKDKFTADGFFEVPFTITPEGEEETQDAIEETEAVAVAAHKTEEKIQEKKRDFTAERVAMEEEVQEAKENGADADEKRAKAEERRHEKEMRRKEREIAQEERRHERAVKRANELLDKSVLQFEHDLKDYDLQSERIGLTEVEIEQLDATNKLNNERERKLAEISNYNLSDAEKNKLQAELNGLYDEQIVKINDKIVANDKEQKQFSTGWANAWAKYQDEANDNAKAAGEMFNTVTKGMEDAFVDFAMTGKFSFKDMIDDMLRQVARLAAKKAFAWILGKFIPGGKEAESFAGMFDKGGFIPGGQWGIVGERGPEIVNGPARVTSREDTAKMIGGSTNITLNINAVDAASFKALVARDPEFITNVALAGARRMPGGLLAMSK